MDLDVGLEHPLAIEILSLREALSQQQRATQQATAQVQKYAFDALAANNRARQLSAENDILQSEVDILRAPRPTASPSTTEAELTLALRRANSRLEHTEKTLQEAEVSVLHAHGERERTAGEVAAAYHLLEEARSQVVELRSTLALHEHEKKSYETALSEYAALVRGLEKRASESEGSPGAGHDGGLAHPAIQVAVGEDGERVKELTTELARTRADLSTLQAQLDVERRVGEEERSKLAETRAELEKRIADDKSAAALVERYMKFSQHHTDVLQRALTDQSTRHEATRNSLVQRIEHLEHTLSKESARNLQLRTAIDTLVDDLARESAGRRREVRVRLAIAGREANVEESLRRWERRIREHPKPQTPSDEAAGLLFGLDDLHQLHRIIDNLGAAIVFRTTADTSHDDSLPGPLARILAAEIAVEALTAELERETTRRMDLERERAQFITSPTDSPRDSLHPKPESQSFSTMPSSTAISLVSHDAASQTSLAESVTTISLQESPQVAFTPVAELPKQETVPSLPDFSPEITIPEAPPSSTSVIPFPVNSPAPPKVQELAQSTSLCDDPGVQELLAQLPTALKRYAPFQAAFRDCHLTLGTLKTELRQKPRSYLLTVVERLDDYNEDARVEVEIRIADEARTANGLEAMLHLGQTDAIKQLQALVDGTMPEVQKAITAATRKRDDLEHDIAAVKLTVHAPEGEPEHGVLLSPNPAAEPVSPGPQSWGWKRPFRQSITTQPASPLGLAFPSPQHTIRRMASGTLGHGRGASLGGNEAKEHTHADPIAAMGLRIPMPAYQVPPPATPTVSYPSSPLRPSHMLSSPLVLERPRTTSMYHLGIGRNPSGLDMSKRLSLTPTSKLPTSDAGEESDDSVE